MWRFVLAYAGFLSLLVNAQMTLTTTDVDGNTIIEVVTTDPVALIPVTSIISTIAAGVTTTSPTATPATTTPDQDPQGPVGAPGPTQTGSIGGPTPYTYTTVIGGVTYTSADIFTPTSPPTISTQIPASGTIWDYSSWVSIYGAQTTSGGKNAASSNFRAASGSSNWFGFSLSTVASVVFGAWLVL